MQGSEAEMQNLILITSGSMDTNKKSDRDEHNLIRMGSAARDNFALADPKVQLSFKTKKSILNIHQAFSKDIKKAKELGLTKEELKQVGFVTKTTFNKLSKIKNGILRDNIFISKPIKPKAPTKPKFSMMIGADPEFLLFDNDGNVVRANNVLPKPGSIGSDGAMIEIRPEPSENPSDLVKNMTGIFSNTELTKLIRNYIWKAAIYYKDQQRDYPVGGHIHLGNPPQMSKYISGQNKSYLFAVFNKIMDELLALPLIKLDGTDLGKARRSECQMAMGNNGYGYYGEWRPCDGRLEHRTLSGLWLMHPIVSECVLGTAKAIAEEMYGMSYDRDFKRSIYKHPNIEIGSHAQLYRAEFDDWSSIEVASAMDCTKSSSYMASMLNTSKARSITKPFLLGWYKRMKRLTTYKKYAKHIDKLYSILSLPQKKVSEVGVDLKKNWIEKNEFPL